MKYLQGLKMSGLNVTRRHAWADWAVGPTQKYTAGQLALHHLHLHYCCGYPRRHPRSFGEKTSVDVIGTGRFRLDDSRRPTTLDGRKLYN